MVKPATWAEVWCPLRGARVRLQSTLRFPSQRGKKHSASPSCQEISGDRKVFFFSIDMHYYGTSQELSLKRMI